MQVCKDTYVWHICSHIGRKYLSLTSQFLEVQPWLWESRCLSLKVWNERCRHSKQLQKANNNKTSTPCKTKRRSRRNKNRKTKSLDFPKNNSTLPCGSISVAMLYTSHPCVFPHALSMPKTVLQTLLCTVPITFALQFPLLLRSFPVWNYTPPSNFWLVTCPQLCKKWARASFRRPIQRVTNRIWWSTTETTLEVLGNAYIGGVKAHRSALDRIARERKQRTLNHQEIQPKWNLDHCTPLGSTTCVVSRQTLPPEPHKWIPHIYLSYILPHYCEINLPTKSQVP